MAAIEEAMTDDPRLPAAMAVAGILGPYFVTEEESMLALGTVPVRFPAGMLVRFAADSAGRIPPDVVCTN